MEIYINDILLINREKINGKYYFTLSNGDILNRKDFLYFKVICNDCNNIFNLLNYPTTKKTYYLCASCKNRGENNPRYGVPVSDETRKKMSESRKGENNPMYGRTVYDVWVDKYGINDANQMMIDLKCKLSEMSSGENNPMYGKTVYDVWVDKYGIEQADINLKKSNNFKSEYLKNNPEHHSKMILASLNKCYKKTSIEKEVELFLIENNINHKYNFIDKYQYDFILPDYNIIIEVNGDYWHANPNIYSDTDINLKNLNERQHYKVDMDIIKKNYIENKLPNVKVFYLWESDIKNNNYKNILWNLLK